jgi:peptide-methionine (S)-S-oxide reductase
MKESGNRSAVAGQRTEVAVLAGGCFWGVEEILRAVPGVLDTEVGYTGGWLPNPTYHDTHDSKSGHAEAVRITFDPAVLSYEELLEQWFFRLHDPTTLNRQGNDIGTQYRSAIFPQTPEQREIAERVKARVDASGKWQRPITTTIEPAGTGSIRADIPATGCGTRLRHLGPSSGSISASVAVWTRDYAIRRIRAALGDDGAARLRRIGTLPMFTT